jgi:hypothetical protein
VVDPLVAVHVAATWYLVGLCWLVQQVQYPLMSRVGDAFFVEYERAHVLRISPVVAPVMSIELVTGLQLSLFGDPVFRSPVHFVALGLIASIWLSTFLLQVPLHRRLESRFDAGDHARLVGTNWLRTIAWSLRGVVLVWILAFGSDVKA